MAFMIEKNVPLPSTKDGRGAPNKGYKALLQHMKVGDSVVVKRAALASIYTHAKKIGCHVVTRKVDQANRRVWMMNKGDT